MFLTKLVNVSRASWQPEIWYLLPPSQEDLRAVPPQPFKVKPLYAENGEFEDPVFEKLHDFSFDVDYPSTMTRIHVGSHGHRFTHNKSNTNPLSPVPGVSFQRRGRGGPETMGGGKHTARGKLNGGV